MLKKLFILTGLCIAVNPFIVLGVVSLVYLTKQQ